MTRLKFIELCEKQLIDPSVAFEDDDLLELIRSGGTIEDVETYLINNF